MRITVFYLKTAGLLLLCIPFVLIILLGIGEIAGGILSGLQHFIQVIPLVLLGYFAWKQPNIGGKIIIIIAGILSIVYLIFPPTGFPILIRLVNAFILFGPVILSGVLFWLSSKKN